MGSFICRQPNGLLCRFSTVLDTITDYNMTDEEYIQMYILERITTVRAEAEDVIKNHLKPFEWIDGFFVDNNMTEEEFEQIKAKMYKPKEKTIKALEQQPYEDAVSRGAVLDLVADYDLSMGQVVKGIHALPPVTPQPKIGHWEWVQYDSNPNIGNWHCSECKTIIPHILEETDNRPIYKWCPMCGTKMVEPQESEDQDKE